MPFQLVQVPAYFTLLKQNVCGQFNDSFLHMEDVLRHDASKNDHLDHLKLIFKRSEKQV